jgi:streptogramin lyase
MGLLPIILATDAARFDTANRSSIGQLQGRGGAVDESRSSNYVAAPWPAPARSAAGFDAPWNFIEIAGIAVKADGDVVLLHRGAHPIMEFSPDGRFLRSWGDGMFSEGKVWFIPEKDFSDSRPHFAATYGPAGCTSCGAHAVRVDREGSLWFIDAAGNAIYKTTPAGKPLMKLGLGQGATVSYRFSLPTDVAFAADGAIFVADGYGGAHVVKFSKEGRLLLEWGTRGKGPGQFGMPHSIVVDRTGRVLVSDRDNQRIEVFTDTGEFVAVWPDVGAVSALAMHTDGSIWTGATLRDASGQVVDRLPDAAGQPHGMAVSTTGDVYLAKLGGGVQKFTRRTPPNAQK